MRPVGRPPETEPDGTIIAKSLVNVTIPTKLASFLKENGVNRSQLFTRIVTMLYVDQICRYCYGTDLDNKPVGVECRSCEKWLSFNDCPNCGEMYDLRKSIGYMANENYNCFSNDNDLNHGCQKCMPTKEFTEDRLSDDPIPVKAKKPLQKSTKQELDLQEEMVKVNKMKKSIKEFRKEHPKDETNETK